MARLSLKAEARRFYFGFWWWVIEPMLYVAVFYTVFYQILGNRAPDFLMFLVVGKFAFIWFSKTVNYAANSLVNNAGLISRMDMPKTLFPVAVILECSYRQLAVFALMGVFLILDGHMPTWHWLWALPLIAVEGLLIVVCGLLASVLVCIKRDFALLMAWVCCFCCLCPVFGTEQHCQRQNPGSAVLESVAFLLDIQVLLQQAPNLKHLLGLAVFLGALLLVTTRWMDRYRYLLAQRVVTA